MSTNRKIRLFYDYSAKLRGVITQEQVYEDYKEFLEFCGFIKPPTFKQYVDMMVHQGYLERFNPKDLSDDHPLRKKMLDKE